MSRISSGLPIYALSPNQLTLNKVNLYRGVIPVDFCPQEQSLDSIIPSLVLHMKSLNLVKEGDIIVVTKGDHSVNFGTTDMIKIVKVGNDGG